MRIKAADPTVSHIDFGQSFSEVTLQSKIYKSNSGNQDVRVFHKLVGTERRSLSSEVSKKQITQHSSSIYSKIKTNDCLSHVSHVTSLTLYSQNDEDGALLQILECMGGHGKKEYFEFGSHNGDEVNTRVLRDLYGWKGHLLDGFNENSEISLHKEFFTPSNIVSLLQKYQVSKDLDVLSIDMDYDDFWTCREILLAGYRPRVLITEYNVNFDSDRTLSVSVLPKPIGQETEVGWEADCYFDASANVFINLA